MSFTLPAPSRQIRLCRSTALVFALLASCRAEHGSAVPAQALRAAAPLKRVQAPPRAPASIRTEPGCASASARLNLNTLDPGRLLVWNASGSALAVGRHERGWFSPLASTRREDAWGSVSLLDVASHRVQRAPAHGIASAIAGSDAFAITGDATVVVAPDGSVLTNLPPASDAPRAPLQPPGFFRGVKARAADVAVGVERPLDEGVVVWRGGHRLKRIAVEGLNERSAWAVNDRGEQVAVGTDRRLQIFALDRAEPVRVVTLPEPLVTLAYRPGSNELALTTTTTVALLRESGAPEVLAARVAEPFQWSAALSATGRTLAAHLDDQLLTLSLTDGSLYPVSPLAQPSTGSYSGLVVASDAEVRLPKSSESPGRAWDLAAGTARLLDANAVSPDAATTASIDDGRVHLISKAGAWMLQPGRDSPQESPTAVAAAFSPDSQTLFVLETLNLPRSAGSRIGAWQVSDGAYLWSQDIDSIGSITPTAHGVITTSGRVERFEDGKGVFSAERAAYAYSPARDLLAVLAGKSVKLVSAGGALVVVPLPFSEPVASLSFDATGRRLALGTATGFHVLDLETGDEIAHTDLGAATETLGFRGDLAICRRVSAQAPERAFSIVDVRSGATLTIGFALTRDSSPSLFVSTSTGWVDGEPAVLAALRDSAHSEAALPAACVRPGLLREWLSAP